MPGGSITVGPDETITLFAMWSSPQFDVLDFGSFNVDSGMHFTTKTRDFTKDPAITPGSYNTNISWLKLVVNLNTTFTSIFWEGTAGDEGTYNASCTINGKTFTIQIVVQNGNGGGSDIAFLNPNSYVVNSGSSWNADLVIDPEDAVTSLIGAPSWISLMGNTMFGTAPDVDTNTDYTFVAKATKSGMTSAQLQITVTVLGTGNGADDDLPEWSNYVVYFVVFLVLFLIAYAVYRKVKNS